MAKTATPKISVVISLSPTTYHFSDPTPPELSLTITSNSERPLTIFTWRTILHPQLALCQRRFVITDLTCGIEVPQTSVRLQRPAFARTRDHPDHQYYLTIHPGTPIVISTPFGRGTARPQPKAIVQRGWALDDDGNEIKIRRSKAAHGVDGLEAGHRYRLDVASTEPQYVWWRWGAKEDNLVDRETAVPADCMLSSAQSEKAALVFEAIGGIDFSVED